MITALRPVLLLALLSSFLAWPGPAPAPPKDRWGIVPVRVQLTTGGYMVYFRYRVTDEQRATPFFDKQLKLKLVDRATGVSAGVTQDTKLGALRSSPRTAPTRGKEYFVLFSNPNGALRSGGSVDVELGPATFKNLVVE